MLVWIASYSRSGNTFFRVVLTHLYDVNTYAAFHAGESLRRANAQQLVNHQELPEPLRSALSNGDANSDDVQNALHTLDADDRPYVFKTHASPDELYGIARKSVLVVRDGRDALASFANFSVDAGANTTAVKSRLRDVQRSPGSATAWSKLGKGVSRTAMKGINQALGRREAMVSSELDQLLESEGSYRNWGVMNRKWLDFEPEPVIVRFDDLVAEPVATVTRTIEALGLELTPKGDQRIPSFDEMKAQYPSFFRKGVSGDWKNWFTEQQERTFWERNGDVMEHLGFQS